MCYLCPCRRLMYGNMATTVLNTAQLEMLRMMSKVTHPEVLNELKQVVSDFFARRAQEEIEHLWESGELNEERIEDFRHLHERTPYK